MRARSIATNCLIIVISSPHQGNRHPSSLPFFPHSNVQAIGTIHQNRRQHTRCDEHPKPENWPPGKNPQGIFDKKPPSNFRKTCINETAKRDNAPRSVVWPRLVHGRKFKGTNPERHMLPALSISFFRPALSSRYVRRKGRSSRCYEIESFNAANPEGENGGLHGRLRYQIVVSQESLKCWHRQKGLR